MNELQLPGVGSLLQEAWQRVQKNLGTLLKLELIAFVAVLAVLAAMVLIIWATAIDGAVLYATEGRGINWQESMPFSVPVALLSGVLGVCVLLVRGVVSIGEVRLLATEGAGTVPHVLRHGWRRLLPAIGNGILLMLIFLPLLILMALPFVAGGAILFYSIAQSLSESFVDRIEILKTIAMVGGISFIFVMPLYFFLFVRLGFVVPLVAIGETAGAWKESWNLAKGRYWAIFWRIFAGSLVIALIGSTVQGIIEQLFSFGEAGTSVQIVTSILGATFGIISQLFFAVFGIAYSVSLLRNTQRIQQG